MHDVASVHKCDHRRLLHTGDRRLGLVKGEVDHRLRKLPHITGRDRVQLHVADIPADVRGEPDRSVQVRLDAELEPHRGRGVQVAVRLDLLPDVPERHAAGDHE